MATLGTLHRGTPVEQPPLPPSAAAAVTVWARQTQRVEALRALAQLEELRLSSVVQPGAALLARQPQAEPARARALHRPAVPLQLRAALQRRSVQQARTRHQVS